MTVVNWHSWVIVAVCFVVYFLNYGIVRISGLFFSDIIFYYNVNRERASTPFLMGSVMRSAAGPFTGYLSSRFGYGFAIISGCIVSSLGIFACSFARDFRILCAFWTVYGFGCGMSTSIIPQVINVFNKRHAAKANGMALCGASIAGILLPFVAVALLNAYGLPGTFLNLSAIMLNAIPCVILLKNTNSRPLKDSALVKDNCRKDSSAEDKTIPDGKEDSGLEIGVNGKARDNSALGVYDHQQDMLVSEHANSEKRTVTTCGKIGAETDMDSNNKAEQAHSSFKTCQILNMRPFDHDIKDSSNTPRELLPCKNSSVSLKILSSRDKRIENKRSAVDGKYLFSKTCSKVASSETDEASSEKSQDHPFIKKKHSCLTLFSIFWDPVFFTFALPRCLSTMLYIIVPTILVDFSIDKGIPKNQTSYILMAYSLADLFGKLCLGWVTDGNYMSKIRYIALWYCIVAFSLGLMAWSKGIAVMTTAVVLVLMGTATILPPLYGLVSQYFEKEKQFMVMASSEIFLIPLSFGTAPLIGYFRDHLGSYNGLVYILSAISVLSSILILLIPTVSSWQMKKIDNNVSNVL